MQQLLTIVSQVREHYINRYLDSLRSFRARYSPAASEVLFEIPRESSYPFRLYRADMASNASEGLEIQEVNPSTHLGFDVLHVEGPNKSRLLLHPIAWNGVDFRVSRVLDREALEAWILRWLDVDDTHEQDLNGLQGVIHSVTEPEARGEYVEFSVDFGSASVEAFEALIEILSSPDAMQIEIRSNLD